MAGSQSRDISVQGTNDDAQISKLSCANLGYFKDDFIKYFVRRSSKRSPLINRGYFARLLALRQLLQQFFDVISQSTAPHEQQSVAQVLSLGAGFDTTFFNVEVDFKEVTQKKAAIIAGNAALHEQLGPDAKEKIHPGTIQTDALSVLPADLRDVKGVEAALLAAGFNPQLPTYVLAECVLVYMEAEESSAVVRWLGSFLSTAACVVYEQIKPGDAFGRQMLMNLESRGCPLRGLQATPDLKAHQDRFLNNGWQRADAKDMTTIYRAYLDPAEKRRAERLEIFDEFEEWHMIQDHYCIVLALNDASGVLQDFGFKQKAPPAGRVPFPRAD
ncbi:leucine carboxyl methyltransferase family protein [Coccomyxa subellipsoidea C-169]|uniref:Leucine carboxyl methyltransferase 1 homolog n=1 Tax=Coccomyxa subellipsoidea (strain C-169) TaxID=574566 RepID=I0YVS1_COCSC|nr:leucine carboxyl methyltransferase family protein [Coccomyxa subellipsoidea C-169]EIE22490.1 leucine carboxyl methyltransferase family protein [Coccomyxa subellipsoidea C-169]|eukprot:XP_005647034.1 leucine carboxyl methyltransferase family protein [Coccomyxa subellipsoidea C-169]